MAVPQTVGEAVAAGYDWIELYWKDAGGVRGTLSTNISGFNEAKDLRIVLAEMQLRLRSGSMVGGGIRKSASRRYDPDDNTWAAVFGVATAPVVEPKRRRKARPNSDGVS